jgi:hypothetical protein
VGSTDDFDALGGEEWVVVDERRAADAGVEGIRGACNMSGERRDAWRVSFGRVRRALGALLKAIAVLRRSGRWDAFEVDVTKLNI